MREFFFRHFLFSSNSFLIHFSWPGEPLSKSHWAYDPKLLILKLTKLFIWVQKMRRSGSDRQLLIDAAIYLFSALRFWLLEDFSSYLFLWHRHCDLLLSIAMPMGTIELLYYTDKSINSAFLM